LPGKLVALEIQVLFNLLDNALKFVAPGVTPSVEIWAEDHHGAKRLSTQDNGVGIDPQYPSLIFEPFESLTQSPEQPSNGIGLAIVKKAMERMGGKVGLESTAVGGSCFWLEFSPSRY